MRDGPGVHVRRLTRRASFACLVVLGFSLSAARADDLIGPYVGAGFGKATLDVSTQLVENFGSDHSAFKLIVGWRPISEIAVELEYVDLGQQTGASMYPNSNTSLSTTASVKGFGAFGLLYLPTPIVDFFLKGGFSRLHTSADTTIVGCPNGGVCPPLTQPPPVSSTDFGFAGGGGVMYRIRAFEVRAEYERFTAGTGNPYLLSLGATWAF
jgi:Outer membrane protein beta-barrel domain